MSNVKVTIAQLNKLIYNSLTFFSCVLDNSVTVFGSNSYVEVTANTQLVFLKDIGSLTIKTLDTDGILFYGAWSHNHVPTGEYITLELVNGSVQLATALQEGEYFIS